MELKQWENEFKGVNSFDEAIDAIEWYEYVSNYYVPSDGYYCSKKMSSKLEAQRSRNIAAYVKALEEYSGLDYGDDLQKWKDWVEKKKAEESSADQ